MQSEYLSRLGSNRSSLAGLVAVPCLLAILASDVNVAAQEIILSDIIAGGDGRGTAPPDNIGIRADLGTFEQEYVNGRIENTGDALQPVGASPLIDSVFIIDQTPLAINSQGLSFDFPAADLGTTWNHILKDKTHSIDVGIEEIWAGGTDIWTTAVSVHASAGVTFDLTGIRNEFGSQDVGALSCFAGTDQCGADLNLYVFVTGGGGILKSMTLGLLANQGESIQLNIPPQAEFA